MELINIHRQTRDGSKGIIDAVHVGLERGEHGVARTDVWCFHDYLAKVMINGLQILREDSHGWPSCEEYPNPEDWDTALIDIIMRLKQASTRDEQHDKIYDEILWNPEDACPAGMEELENWINREPSPEWKEYSRRCREVDDLAQENIEHVTAWLAKWWFALWD
jgi:hypothetical protein